MGIGRRIKEARENAGLTQEELGKLVGVTGSAITNYEKETSHPKESVMYSLIEALGVDANYLFQDCVKTKKAPGTHGKAFPQVPGSDVLLRTLSTRCVPVFTIHELCEDTVDAAAAPARRQVSVAHPV